MNSINYKELANNLTDEVVDLRIENEKLEKANKELTEQLRIAVVVGRSAQLSDSLQDQIKRGELDPYSPHAKWIKP